jgi:hypothetical protein
MVRLSCLFAENCARAKHRVQDQPASLKLRAKREHSLGSSHFFSDAELEVILADDATFDVFFSSLQAVKAVAQRVEDVRVLLEQARSKRSRSLAATLSEARRDP